MLGSHYANRSFYDVLYEQLHLFVDSKIALKLPAVYATDRSDAVVLVLFLFCFVLLFTTGCYIVLGLLFGIVCVCSILFALFTVFDLISAKCA